ncbi:MAG: NADase-type glycan-binding domain-containing protein [Jiangellaceae bacterium]
MFDRLAEERPAGAVVAGLLTGCALLGFLTGAVLGSAGSGGGTDEVATAADAQWEGAVEPLVATVADASCHGESSADAGGNRVTYEPEHAVDDEIESAWRCEGDGVGETLVLDLGGSVEVAEVGLVPGYAKTDPVDGTDRYAENRRITSVRWHFDDGTTVEQALDPDTANRELQSMRIPLRQTAQLVLEILSSSDASRDRVAVSDLRISAPVQ